MTGREPRPHRIEEARATLVCRPPEGDSVTLIVFRTLDDRARREVWVNFSSTTRFTAVLSPAQATELAERVRTAAESRG